MLPINTSGVNTREGEELFILKDYDGTRTNGYKLTMKKGGNLKRNEKVTKTRSSPEQ